MIENSSCRRVFSAFPECTQISGVFYHSVIHSLGFISSFALLDRGRDVVKNNKTRFSVLYSDKTWVFGQSKYAFEERIIVQGRCKEKVITVT